MQLALILGWALPVVMVAIGSAGIVRGYGKDHKRLKRRMASLSMVRSATVAPLPEFALTKGVSNPGFYATSLARLCWLVGYDDAVPNRPMPNWLAVTFVVAAARGVTWLVTSLAGPLGWLAFPFVALLLLRSYFIWCARRWRTALFKQFPDALSTIVRTVRVGVSMVDGIRRVADEAAEPTAAIFAQVSAALAIGTPLTDALVVATARTGLPEYRFFTTALVLQSRTGGGLATTLEGLADVIRKRVMVRARGKALAAEARTSAIVLATLPAVTVGGMMLVNPDYMTDLFVTQRGHAILAMACLSEGIGILVMRSMILRALS